MMIRKKERSLEWAISFWLGICLMSIINVWKIDYNQNALSYSWIMFGISLVFLAISAIYLGFVRKANSAGKV